MRFELLPSVPAVVLVRRLKETPLFRFVSIDELFRISSISRQVRYLEKSSVQVRGGAAEYIQVLLHGRLRLDGGGDPSSVLSPPGMLAFREVLKGTALQEGAVAETESIALVMPAEEFRTLLAANIELAQGLFRMLLEPGAPGRGGTFGAGEVSFGYQKRRESLSTVEKVMYLQSIPIFSHATAEEIYDVAAVAREISLDAGETLFSAGTVASIVLLLSGELDTSSPEGGTERAAVGSCLGAPETLAGAPWARTAVGVSPGSALQIERDALFEILSDRMDLLQGIFSAVFHGRDGKPERRGKAAGSR